jgi:hypothetical protein
MHRKDPVGQLEYASERSHDFFWGPFFARLASELKNLKFHADFKSVGKVFKMHQKKL